MELELADVYLPTLLKEVTENARIWAQQHGISFEQKISPDLPKGVRVDEKRLRQVLLNLINNAIKFTEQGQVLFKVIANPPAESGNKFQMAKIRFEIEDTGIGISPDKLDEIFLPFHQVNAANLKAEGTGLGLPISRNLLRLMDSDLHVKSVLGKGTTFWFDLETLVIERNVSDRTFRSVGSSRNITVFKGKKREILLVDDNEKNRTLLKDMLSPLGFKIEEAVDGKDALEKAKKTHPDLILMDLVMPVMDGIEATQYIRQDPVLKNIIIIGISASAFDTTKQASFKAGCNDFLTKPIHINILLQRIQVNLELQWIYDQTAETESEKQLNPEILPPVLPPKEYLTEILKFSQISHITGIQQSLDKIRDIDEKYIPFIKQVENLLEGFQFDQIIALIESHAQVKNHEFKAIRK
jgi:CheY-like chemotaxis protein